MKNQRIVTRRKQIKLNKKRVKRDKMRRKMRYNDLQEAIKKRTKKKNEKLQSNPYNAKTG